MYNNIQDLINNPEPGNINDQGIIIIEDECKSEYPCKHNVSFKSKDGIDYEFGLCSGYDIYKLIHVQRNYTFKENNSKVAVDEHFSYLKNGLNFNIHRNDNNCNIQ
jgi:hypothetical protein